MMTMEKKICRKRLSIAVTIINFVAMFLQLAKYITAQNTKVSGYNKILMNVIASVINIYLKFTSHDKEHNNPCHLMIFVIRRMFVFGVFCYFMYIDSLRDFSSFYFDYEERDNIIIVDSNQTIEK